MISHRKTDDALMRRMRLELMGRAQDHAWLQDRIAVLRSDLRALRQRQRQTAEYLGGSADKRGLLNPPVGPAKPTGTSLADASSAPLRVRRWLEWQLVTHGLRRPVPRLLRRVEGLMVAGAGTEPLAPPGADADRLSESIASTRAAVDQSWALVQLLQNEARLLRGAKVRSARVADENPDAVVRHGAVVPTDGMLSRMAGRIRISWLPDAPAQAAPPTITAAVRFHDLEAIPDLQRCLYSLQAQRDVDLQVLVMVQGGASAPLRAIERMIDSMWLGVNAPRVIGVPNPGNADLRAGLLNRALDIHYGERRNDFFYILDHDDLVFSHALRTLASPLVGSEVAVAFGKVLTARYLSLDGYDVLYAMDDHFQASSRDVAELLVDNFFPVHAYIYHTRAMPPGYLRFNDSMDRLEDYECLLRIVTAYPASIGSLAELIGLYRWKGDRAVRGPIEGSSDRSTTTWDRNRRLLATTMIAIASQPTGIAA